MKELQITAKKEAKGADHTVKFDMPESTSEAVKVYGEDVVYSRFLAAMKVDIQGFMRQKLNAETPLAGAALQKAINDWKPGVRNVGPGKIEKLKERLAGLSEEERQALFAGMTSGNVAAKPAASKPTKPTLVKGGAKKK